MENLQWLDRFVNEVLWKIIIVSLWTTATVDHVYKSSTLNIQLIDLREGLFPGV